MSNYFRTLRRPLLALPALIALATACGGESPRNFDRTAFTQSGVQGGTADSADTGVVLIIINQGGGYGGSCTGTLIARNVVLTARHCVADTYDPNDPQAQGIDCSSSQFGNVYPASSFYVFNDQTYSDSSFAYHVKQVIVPSGSTMCGNDVALLVLAENFNTSVAKLIEPRFTTTYGGEAYSAVGYGKTCPSCNDGGEARMRRNNLEVSCVGSSCGWGSTIITDKEWGGDNGVCSGDSGGPALDTQGRVIGVASRAGEANGLCVQSMYERVNSWQSFITTNTINASNAAGLTPPAWTGGGTGGSGGAPNCDTCGNQVIVPGEACAASWSACINSDDCVALLECWNAAGTNAAAQDKCIVDHQPGYQTYEAIWVCTCTPAACGANSCATECKKDSCGFQVGGATCNTCFEGKCCDKGKACEENTACRMLLTCIGACPDKDQACVNKCSTANPGGTALYNGWLDCLETSCAKECGFSTGTGGSGGSSGSGGSAGSPGQGGAPQGGAAGSPAQGGADPGEGGSDPGQGGEDPGVGGEGGEDPGQTPTPLETSTDGGCSTSPSGSGSLPAWAAVLAAAAMIASRRERSRR